MSSTKTFVVDTNMQVNGDLDVTGTVTANPDKSFIGDGSQLTGIWVSVIRFCRRYFTGRFIMSRCA